MGSAVGEFAISAAIKTGNTGKVLAFEPDPINYRYLCININQNNLENIKTFKKAAWSKKAILDFHISKSMNSHSLLKEGSWGLKKNGAKAKINVKAIRVDKILEDCNMDIIDFIKIDVEGAELKALQGMKKILLNGKKIVIESHFGEDDVEILEKLNGFNFETRTKKSGSHNIIYGKKAKNTQL